MNILHQLSPTSKYLEPRPAFLTPAGSVYRQAAQGGIRRVTSLDMALMQVAAAVAVWRLEANQEG